MNQQPDLEDWMPRRATPMPPPLTMPVQAPRPARTPWGGTLAMVLAIPVVITLLIGAYTSPQADARRAAEARTVAECPACGHTVARDAFVCPKCGKPEPGR